MKSYKVYQSISFSEGTPKEVMDILINCRTFKTRLKFTYGDNETGRNWNEENDTTGYVGLSTGFNRVPLLIANSRSDGGGTILTDRIIRIQESNGGRVLYQASNFQAGTYEIVESDLKDMGYTHNMLINGELYSRHKTLVSAERLVKKLK